MSDGITGKILKDAKSYKESAEARAEERAAQIMAEYERRAAGDSEALKRSAEKEAEANIRRAEAAAELTRRNAVLRMRAALLDEAYAHAAKRLMGMAHEEYIKLLARAAAKAAIEGEGELILNAAERASIGEKLAGRANALAGGGARFRLSGGSAAIGGGFILKYGGAEVNCSISALVEEARRSTEDRAARALFGDRE